MPSQLPQQRGFYVSATKKSSGKTVVSLGIAAALRQKNLSVQSFKKGPDYIDPMWHQAATGQPCFNLDFFTQSRQEINETFNTNRQQSDIVYVEGNKGLFDGLDTFGGDCNAALAQQLALPVVLVVNTVGMTRGIAPLLYGYEHFGAEIDFAGIILNEVGGPRHLSKLLAAIKEYTDFKVLGAIPKTSDLHLQERHLGLIPENEATFTETYIQQAANIVNDNVDLNRVLESSVTLTLESKQPANIVSNNIKIGIAQDNAFGFYYPDDLQAMKSLGVELVFFDTLIDIKLPIVDALFIGGGFPETHIKQLNANQSMRSQIKQFIDSGKPAYAECGGLMYLCKSISYQGECAEMVGVIDADVTLSKRPVGRGYACIQASQSHPWKCNQTIKNCHEFHYSKLEGPAVGESMAYDIKRGHGVNEHFDGLVINNTLATYCHQRNTENNPWIVEFIDFIKQIKSEKQS